MGVVTGHRLRNNRGAREPEHNFDQPVLRPF